jgi:hypothetical protein
MHLKLFMRWLSLVSGILVIAGIVFSFFGLAILPVDHDVLLPWQSALYGAIMIGWGMTLFFSGRLAFRRKDAELMKNLLYGLVVWLLVEALFSLYFGVFFNIGVDIAVLVLFTIPLTQGIRSIKRANAS